MGSGKYFNLTFKLTGIVGLLFLFGSCSEKKGYSKTIKIKDAYFTGTVIVEKIEKLDKYRISIFDSITRGSDLIYTPYEVFEMETGDVNMDGRTDICIGIIKPTPFDPVLKKRLFIFQIDRDYIRPLWLSSRLVNPLEEFKVCKKKGDCTIKAMERQNKGMYCIHEYRWESFGMSFIKTLNDSLSYSRAQEALHNSH